MSRTDMAQFSRFMLLSRPQTEMSTLQVILVSEISSISVGR